nr:MAG TPA: Metalloprotease stcE [Caudoviricetes sp.]
MTKQELLSTPAFQNARDDAFIYFVAWFDGGSWIRHVTVPKKEDQTRDCIRFRSFEPLISKIRLLANLSFRHSRGDKVLTFQYLNGWHKTGECSVDINSDGNIVISEKIKEEDYAK